MPGDHRTARRRFPKDSYKSPPIINWSPLAIQDNSTLGATWTFFVHVGPVTITKPGTTSATALLRSKFSLHSLWEAMGGLFRRPYIAGAARHGATRRGGCLLQSKARTQPRPALPKPIRRPQL